jgi:DNA-directed RNA polymerase subunit RPC12/RpoP
MNNSFSLTCSQCGGQIQFPKKGRIRIKCPYCGTEQVLTGEVAQQVQMEGVHICPVCNKDDKLEKVSAIVLRETRGREDRSILAQMLTLSIPDYYDLSGPERFAINIPTDPGPVSKEKKFRNTLKTIFAIIGCCLFYMYNYFFHWMDIFTIWTFL